MTGPAFRQTEFNMLGIGTVLLRNRLVVPLNQREYSWEDRHVQELFQDLAGAISSGKQTYFLGVIVLTNGTEGNLEIADGQQRLATTTILLTAFRNYFHNRNDQEMVRYLQGFLDTFVPETREHTPRLRLNVTDHEFFRRRVLEIPGTSDPVTATQPSHYLLDRAAVLAEQHVQNILSPLSESAQSDHLINWLSFIENSAQVIILKVSDDMNAYVMFETLNDRGLRVSQADLVKNYLFSEATNRIAEAQARWSSMGGVLEMLDDDDSTITFLRHFLISLYGPVRERDVLEMVRNNIRGRTAVMGFLDDLSSASSDYVALQMPTDGKWTGQGSRMRQIVDDLLLLRVTPLRPLMLSVVRKFDSAEREVAFRRFVSWSVRWLIAGGARSGSVESAIGAAAKRVTAGEITTADALTDALESSLRDDLTFSVAFRSVAVANHRLARYYLRTLEASYHNEAEPEWIPNWDTVITLEHVLPQRPGAGWAGIEPAIHAAYHRRLGNMALLAATLNRNIGNDPFHQKREVLGSSDYQLTREVVLENVWGPTEIEKRQDRLAELAIKAWPLR